MLLQDRLYVIRGHQTLTVAGTAVGMTIPDETENISNALFRVNTADVRFTANTSCTGSGSSLETKLATATVPPNSVYA